MTQLQFISLIGTTAGSFILIILAWLNQNQRLGDLRADTNRQFADARTETDRRFDDVNRQFADVNRQFTEVRASLATLSEDYQRFYGMEQKLEGRVDELSKRVA